MKRLRLLSVFLLVCSVLDTTPAWAQTSGSRPPTLRERLVAGLQVRRPTEYEFVDAVVDTVNRGELPEKLVNRVFFWARSRSTKGDKDHRPVIYFQAGLTRVAAKLRIDIEADQESTGATG